ncbi:hypothetical protein [Bacillus sp. FJAT-27245]|uniref:hypothetical protein n=1 Tax=Bacillus sp. FJAT-27245 TaxID=1684144 RepID=UPI0006A75A76|nr:hypothetical protein [Bacillus sp. FJAT-27245]
MLRFLFFLISPLILLVGCQGNDDISSTTPKEALERLHLNENYAEVKEIYETVNIHEGRVISVYKGILDNDEDIFVANIEKEDGKWLVTDAANIGMPSAIKLNQSSSTEKFEAGYTNEKSTSKENVNLIEIDNNEYTVWIEVF